MRVADGQIIGRAKLCDFGVSRNAEPMRTPAIETFTRATGTELYFPTRLRKVAGALETPGASEY